MAIAPLLAIPLLLFAPGYLALASWQRARNLDFWERLFLAPFISILITSWVGLVLAETGVFSLPFLSLILTVFCLSVAVFARDRLRPGWLGRPNLDRTSILLIAIMLLAGWAFSRPAEVVAGTFDPGIYLATGASIAHYGSIAVQDPFLSQVEPSLRPFLIEQRGEIGVGAVRLPAFWMPQASGNTVVPAFFHLYPVWLAILYSVGGLQAALFVSPIFGLMGVWALFLLGRRLMGPGVALLAAALLAVNPAQVWFARYPISEATIQMFLLGGLTLWVLMEERKSRLLAMLAGVSLGLSHLAKVDQAFVPITVALSLLLVWIFRQQRGRDAPVGRLQAAPEADLIPGTVDPSHPVSEAVAPERAESESVTPVLRGVRDVPPARLYMYLLIPYALLLIHSAIHVYVFSFAYTWINLGPFLPALRSTPAVILYVAVALPLIAAVFFREEASVIGRRLLAHRARASLGLALVVWLAATYGYFLWPLNPDPGNAVFLSSDGITPVYLNLFREEGLVRLGWYLTPLGLLLGLSGFVIFSGWHSDHRSLPVLFLFSCETVLYLLTAGMAYPVHFWAIRRYVPLVIPVFLLLASFFLFRLKIWSWRRGDGSPTRLYLAFGHWLHWRASSGKTTKPRYGGVKWRIWRSGNFGESPGEGPGEDRRPMQPGDETVCGDEPVARLQTPLARFSSMTSRATRRCRPALSLALPAALALALLAWSFQASSDFLGATEYQGALQGLGRWASRMEDPAIVLFKPRMEGNILSSPLQNFFGKTSFVLQKEMEGTFYSQGVERWIENGNKVYLVLSDRYPQHLSGDIAYRLIDDQGIEFRNMEQTTDRMPEKAVSLSFPIRLYRMEPASGYPYRLDLGPLLVDGAINLPLGRPSTSFVRITMGARTGGQTTLPVSLSLGGTARQVVLQRGGGIYDFTMPVPGPQGDNPLEMKLQPSAGAGSETGAIVLEWLEVAEATGP